MFKCLFSDILFSVNITFWSLCKIDIPASPETLAYKEKTLTYTFQYASCLGTHEF